MSYQDADGFMCCQCFEYTPRQQATFDLYWGEEWTLVDVCPKCRMAETYWMIRKLASYGDSNS